MISLKRSNLVWAAANEDFERFTKPDNTMYSHKKT
jgi:hypothetical protein